MLVGFEHQRHRVCILLAVERDREAFFEADGDLFALDLNVVAPEGGAHDRDDDLHAAREELEVLGFVGCAEDVGVGRVGFLSRHLVAEAGLLHEGRHLGAAAELVDEGGVEPRLVDLEVRIDQQAVAIEALDVVALEGRAVAPDVDVVFLHRGHQHGAGDRAADRRRVEVGDAGGGDVERAGLERGDAFANQRAAAVDEARLFGAVLERLARNLVVVGFVGLTEVGGVGVRQRALLLHPVKRGAGVQPAGEGDADLLADGQGFENYGHGDADLKSAYALSAV